MTPSEKKALLIVTGTILLSLIVQWIRPHIIRTDLYDYTMQDSLFKVLTADTTRPYPFENPRHNEQGEDQSGGKKLPGQASININTAGQKDLERLPRVGPAMAKRIMEYRKINGPFRNIKSLQNVRGIGEKTLKQLEPYINVNSDSI